MRGWNKEETKNVVYLTKVAEIRFTECEELLVWILGTINV